MVGGGGVSTDGRKNGKGGVREGETNTREEGRKDGKTE